MSETHKISITIYSDTHGPGNNEHNDLAFVDIKVHHNWISHRLVNQLELAVSSMKKEISEECEGEMLQATGVVKISWSRNDVQTPICFNDVGFLVVATNKFAVLIGNKLLSKEPQILKPKDGVLPITSAKKPTAAEQDENRKRNQESQDKIGNREAVRAEAMEAEKTKASGQGGSSDKGGSSSRGGSSSK
ncbi:hypothetical protein MMC17_001634 [Xylographa soralifera]|nr:hypothetical protein [Xylographa soralifera]